MKENELRIGNLVRGFDGEVFTWSLNSFFMLKDSGVDLNEYLKEPIPLTEEWLVKFGFKTDNNVEFYCESGYDWALNFGELEFRALNIVIKNVHQLQNLYFTLTGEELTIK